MIEILSFSLETRKLAISASFRAHSAGESPRASLMNDLHRGNPNQFRAGTY